MIVDAPTPQERRFRSLFFWGAMLMLAGSALAFYAHGAPWRRVEPVSGLSVSSNGLGVWLHRPEGTAVRVDSLDDADWTSGVQLESPVAAVWFDWWTVVWAGCIALPVVAGLCSHWWRFDTLSWWRATLVWAATGFALLVVVFLAMALFALLVNILHEFEIPAFGRRDDDEPREREWVDEAGGVYREGMTGPTPKSDVFGQETSSPGHGMPTEQYGDEPLFDRD